MKVLVDSCVWGGVQQALLAEGHDVIWAGDSAKDPGDEDILAQAYKESRVLITLDKDFGTLALLHGKPHAGIVRLVNLTAQQQVMVCIRVLARHEFVLRSGAIITAELDRVQIRQP